MGQLANQMLLEWCHKMIRKLTDKKKSSGENEIPAQKKADQKTGIQGTTGLNS